MPMIGVIPYWARTKIVKMLSDSTADHVYYIAWGTGTTAASNTDLQLVTEVDRGAATISEYTTSELRVTKDFTIAAAYNGYVAAEAGVFDADGNLIYRGLFSSTGEEAMTRTLATADVLRITIDFYVIQGTL